MHGLKMLGYVYTLQYDMMEINIMSTLSLVNIVATDIFLMNNSITYYELVNKQQ